MNKVAAPRVALWVMDDAFQAHGGAGIAQDFGLARPYARMRAIRIVDGPGTSDRRSKATGRCRRL